MGEPRRSSFQKRRFTATIPHARARTPPVQRCAPGWESSAKRRPNFRMPDNTPSGQGKRSGGIGSEFARWCTDTLDIFLCPTALTLKLEFQLQAGAAWHSNGCAREQTCEIDHVNPVSQVSCFGFKDHRFPIPSQHVHATSQIERIRRPHPRSEEHTS